MGSASTKHGRPANPTMFQGFEWYLPGQSLLYSHEVHDGKDYWQAESLSHWVRLKRLLPELKKLGINSMWIPPACKATNADDQGYGIYDLYDLGEFNSKGSTRTKWGTKRQLEQYMEEARKLGMGIIFDAVLNHRASADASEEAQAVRVDPKKRTRDIDNKPRTIESWTLFNYDARAGKYSRLKYNKDHFSAVDWDSKTSEKAIFKFTGRRPDGTKKGWAKDVATTENGNYDYLMFTDVDYGNVEVREDVKAWGRWIVDQLQGISGFRLDAIKHYSANFQREFVDHVQYYAAQKGIELFFVGEYWLQSSKFLAKHIKTTFEGKIHMFDVKLVYNLSNISAGRIRDLRKVFSGTLVDIYPQRAVTFVANHDTQEEQSLAAPVEPWFVPHAYAFILLRKGGVPCVFWGDLYGLTGPRPRLPACGGRLARLLLARQLFAHGDQVDCMTSSENKDPECVAWSRYGICDQRQSSGLVVLASISWSWRRKRIHVGRECAGQIWTDIMGWSWSGVLIDEKGYGEFPVGPRNISVWTWEHALGRKESQLDELVYPTEIPLHDDLEGEEDEEWFFEE